MALRRTSEPRVCLDKVIETMYETGKDMNAKYRETSRGGLAMRSLLLANSYRSPEASFCEASSRFLIQP
ncbi:L-serine ammonia-lyase, iron-sulfur-dependent, subunit alpha [Escherichia coli]